MSLVVQKFGGTSVADSHKIMAAARKAIRAQQQGHQVVMVVSAMGKQTDLLVELAQQIHVRPPDREMDMLLSTGEQVSAALMAMAIDSLGHKAISLTGTQIGIHTDSTHTKARIRSINTDRMQQLLNQGNILIAAGFQGVDEDADITTLGRGGSDTTAVALAAVLRADACEIYTDVDGIYTTDPRIVPEARRVNRVSYDEMLELARLGAGVMHRRSIEFAKKYNVQVHVRSSLTDTAGTLITDLPESNSHVVCGAAVTLDDARVSLLRVADVPGTSWEVFSRLAERKITVDMIVQNVGEQGLTDLSFTVPCAELESTLDAMSEVRDVVAAHQISHDDQVSKVSVVGLGMVRRTGVAEAMFRALTEVGINIQMITTSEIKISVLVDRSEAKAALRAVHPAFELDAEPAPKLSQAGRGEQVATADVADVLSRLRGVDMEELFLDEITLDQQQARVTMNGVPDSPGIAAEIFEEIAGAGVLVDMIVQSYHEMPGRSSLSLTVPERQLEDCLQIAGALSQNLGCQSITHCPHAAKLSVSGVGLRSHTSVAIRMFRALSEADINVEMINTSEVRVNIVVAGELGSRALQALQDAFADVLR